MTEIILIFAPEDDQPAAVLAEALSALGLNVARQPLVAFSEAVRSRIAEHAASIVCWSRRSVLDDLVLDAALFAADTPAANEAPYASRYCGVILDDTLRALLPKPFFMKDALPLVRWFESAPHQRYDEPSMSRLLQTLEALTGRTEPIFVAQAMDARLSDELGQLEETFETEQGIDDSTSEDNASGLTSIPDIISAAEAEDVPPPGLPPDVAAILSRTDNAVAAAASETHAHVAPELAADVDDPAAPNAPLLAPQISAEAPPTDVPEPTRLIVAPEPTPQPVESLAPEPALSADSYSAPAYVAELVRADPLADLAVAPVNTGMPIDAESDAAAHRDDQEGLISELQMQLTGLRIQRGIETAKFEDQDAKFAQLQSDLVSERSAAADARTAAERAQAAAADATAIAEQAMAEAASLRAETSKLVRAVEEARQAYASALRQQKGLEAQLHAGDQTLREVMSQREELLAARAHLEKSAARTSQELSAVTAKFNEAENARKTYELALLDRKTEILSLQSKLDAAGLNPKAASPPATAANDTGPAPVGPAAAAAAKGAVSWAHVPWRSIAAGGVFAGVMLSYAAVSTNNMFAEWLAKPGDVTAQQPSAPAASPPVMAQDTTPPPQDPSTIQPPPEQTAQTDIAVPVDPNAAPVAEPEAPPQEGPLGVPVSDQVLFNPDGLPPPDPDTRPPPQDLPPMQQKPRLLLKPPAPAE
jgi:hypothetical protein